MADFLGFRIERIKDSQPQRRYVEKEYDDGSLPVVAGGITGQYVDIEGSAYSETGLINRYREMSQQPEAESAIDDITNEAIVTDQGVEPVKINVDNVKYSDNIKKKIIEEFDRVLKHLGFTYNGYDIFRQWYIDGRLYYFIDIDVDAPEKGIKKLTRVDPRKIRKVVEIQKKQDEKGLGYIESELEFFVYNEKGISDIPTTQTAGKKIAPDSIVYVTSGLRTGRNEQVLSYLHKAIKPLNQLRMLEDAVVIYRISRAPERRIFYIDVGNLPKMKAEQYLRDIMVKYKNKLTYDVNTGEVRDDRRHMSMLEDYWIPRREGGRGTEISTLPAGQNLGELEDINYFQRKLYKSLNVPATRLENDNSFTMGRATEITRDELKFNRFITRLRNRFSHLFDSLLEKQLLLKGIISPEDWQDIRNNIHYEFEQDTYFKEGKEVELLRERLGILRDISEYAGQYFSQKWIQQNILRMKEVDIEEMQNEIEKERKEGKYDQPEDGGRF